MTQTGQMPGFVTILGAHSEVCHGFTNRIMGPHKDSRDKTCKIVLQCQSYSAAKCPDQLGA